MPDVQNSVNIVLIDPDEDYRMKLAEYLRKEGFVISGILFSLEGLDYLRNPPDVLILGFWNTAPIFYRMVERLKERYEGVKIIMYVGDNDRIVQKKILEKGIDGYFMKDKVLNHKVRRLITSVIPKKKTPKKSVANRALEKPMQK